MAKTRLQKDKHTTQTSEKSLKIPKG